MTVPRTAIATAVTSCDKLVTYLLLNTVGSAVNGDDGWASEAVAGRGIHLI